MWKEENERVLSSVRNVPARSRGTETMRRGIVYANRRELEGSRLDNVESGTIDNADAPTDGGAEDVTMLAFACECLVPWRLLHHQDLSLIPNSKAINWILSVRKIASQVIHCSTNQLRLRSQANLPSHFKKCRVELPTTTSVCYGSYRAAYVDASSRIILVDLNKVSQPIWKGAPP